jgi:hypothetical protein
MIGASGTTWRGVRDLNTTCTCCCPAWPSISLDIISAAVVRRAR